jgi:D-alanyl-D-alanine carboxypeptidase (penicillin-binding protein 5/6)
MKRIFHPWMSIVIVLLLLGYCGYAIFRTMPAARPNNLSVEAQTSPSLNWPSQGESAVGIVGTNILQSIGDSTPKPTASTAKLITALMVLKAKPLSVSDTGPTVTLTQADVNIYNAYLAEDGSVVQVQAGEQITEYQMLEAMLLPSANNIADSLAIWAYGSLSAYSTAANAYVKSLGLSATTIGPDASGYLPATVSDAHDLVKIGEVVMQNPVLAGIVDQSSASGIPVVGNINNVDSLLGSNNIVGVKTGNSDQAGGVFVGAVKFNLNGSTKVIVTANIGADNLNVALSGSQSLLQSVQTNFHNTVVLHINHTVAYYTVPWSKVKVGAVVNKNVTADIWGGQDLKLNLTALKPISYKTATDTSIGTIQDKNLSSSSSSVSLSSKLPSPSIVWRLTHAFTN